MVVSTFAAATTRSCYCTMHGRSPLPFIAACNIRKNLNLHSISVSSMVSADSYLAKGNGAETSLDYYSSKQTKTTSRFLCSGRSRKRPRPWRRNLNGQRSTSGSLLSNGTGGHGSASNVKKANNIDATLSGSSSRKDSTSDEKSLSPRYPKGKPWRVLWPRPHGVPQEQSSASSLWDFHKRIPTSEQVKAAWVLYKETWEDGLSGSSTKKPKERTTHTSFSGTTESSPIILTTEEQLQLHEIGDNATKNLNIVRSDAQDLLEHTKETTGIRTQDDLKALVSEAMKIATECIQEFMAGYRKGRDSEIDKMLHEYFQDEDDEANNKSREKEQSLGGDTSNGNNPNNVSKISNNGDKTSSGRATMGRKKKKRKPKRGIPRG